MSKFALSEILSDISHHSPYHEEYNTVNDFDDCHDAVPRSILIAAVPALSEVTPVI